MTNKTIIKAICAKTIFVLIITLALIIRLAYLNLNHGLNYDELYSWRVASQAFPFGIIEILAKTDYHPPFYFFILHFWIKFFGNSDIVMQLLSIFFSTLNVWVMYLIGKEIKSRPLGLFLAFFASFLTFFIEHSLFVRFYILACFFGLLGLLFALKSLKKPNNKNIICFCIANLLLLYTQTTGVFYVFVLVILLGIYIYKFQYTKLKWFINSQIIFLIAYLPQLVLTIIQIYNSKQTLLNNPWAWAKGVNVYACLAKNIKFTLFTGFFNAEWKYYLISLIILFIIWCYLEIKNQNKNSKFVFFVFFSYLFLYLFSHIIKLTHLTCFNNYYILLDYIFIILFFTIIFNLKNKLLKGLFLFLMVFQTLFATLETFKIQKYYQLKTIKSFGSPIKLIKNSKYDKGIIFAPYGDELFKKYYPSIITTKIDGDKIFTMSNYQEYANMIFDDDLSKMSLSQRYQYLDNYILQKKCENKLKKTYNSFISGLKKGEYFSFLLLKERYIDQKRYWEIVSSRKDLEIGKPHVIMSKIVLDLLMLAKKDPKMQPIEVSNIDDIWILIVYKKITE